MRIQVHTTGFGSAGGGEVTLEEFSILKPSPSVRSFQTWASGKFILTADGTRIFVVFSMHPFVQVLQILVLAFLTSLLVLIGVAAAVHREARRVVAAWPLSDFFVIVLAILWFGHRVADDDEPFLISILKLARKAELFPRGEFSRRRGVGATS